MVTRTLVQSRAEHYLQTGDITLCADATATTCTAFVPIGSDYTDNATTDTPFRGSYDGGATILAGYGSTVGSPVLPRYWYGGCSVLWTVRRPSAM